MPDDPQVHAYDDFEEDPAEGWRAFDSGQKFSTNEGAAMTLDELKNRVRALAEGAVSLSDFSAWFGAASWNDGDLDFPTSQLAADVQLVLAEFTSGLWTWDEARDRLDKAIPSPFGQNRIEGNRISTYNGIRLAD